MRTSTAFPILVLLGVSLPHALQAQAPADRSLVPAAIRNAILQEYSGELAQAHVQVLSLNRSRPALEYSGTFMETAYLQEMATRYGLSDVRVDYFPSSDQWLPETADLWMVTPERRKIAGLTMVPAALAGGSASADVETELVYVGSGAPADYAGKDVTGKIVLGNAGVGQVFAEAVIRHGAVGALGTGSPGVTGNAAGYSLDQIGWASVRPGADGRGFGFALSLRQFTELRDLLERGEHVVLKATVRTRTVQGRMNVISAAIPGTDPTAGEVMMVAHAFERPPTPGASDNASGVAVSLEIGRTLAELIRRGELPRPRRTIRFLWVPEISGSRAFMSANPGIEDRLIAAINFDMPGEDLEETDSYLRLKMTPDSRPSYLNDLIADLLRFVDQTEVRTQTGNNAPFNYRMVPFIAASDHVVFLEAGIPAIQFNHWPDNFYHSSGDVAERTDPTEMRRTGFTAAAASYYVAAASTDEALALAWEAAASGEKWIAEVARQSARLLDGNASEIHDRYAAAHNKVYGAFRRAQGAVGSVTDLSRDATVTQRVGFLGANLEQARDLQYAKLQELYRARCRELGARPRSTGPTAEEQRFDQVVPRKTADVHTDAYAAASARLPGLLPQGMRLSSLASSEIQWFVNGERSVTEVWRLVRAEYGNVTTSNGAWKFAYVVTPDTPDITLAEVVAYLEAMEKAGMVEMRRR